MNSVLRSGAAGLALAFTSVPFAWSWLAPLPLAVLFFELSRARSRRAAFRLAFVAGTAFFGVHLAWLFTSFTRLFGPLGGVLTLLVVPLLALTWALVAALARTPWPLRTLTVLPFAWVLGEYARTLGPLAFPWGALGYAWLPTPVVQVADLGGVSLLSLLVTGTAAALAALTAARRLPLVGMLGLLVLATVYGTTRAEPPRPNRTALIVQGAMPPLDKAVSRQGTELDVYLTLTRRALPDGAVDLIVWPESASPRPPSDPSTRAALTDLLAPLVTGAPTWGQGAYWNSAYAVDGGVTGRYDKVHPVPFGEFFPWRQALAFAYTPVLGALGLPDLWGVTPGTSYWPLTLQHLRVGAYISYESVFGQAARTLTANGAHVLAHLSNDAWFDRTNGKEQHFQMGRLRAIETRRYVLRASNDGISGVVDPLGRVTARFPEGQRGTYRAPFDERTDRTPFVRWGDWPVGAAALAWAISLFSRRLNTGGGDAERETEPT
ncbi:apolipoprotein N-acyltransferase [Deinococcus sp. YIM 77859]|uniref:apolipoprotein N-acyltransferase n=1 Tax=Deinococcus sp. YIM 77859 TaxID=1540221 RepID=UPI00068F1691|nr:apolipoprotein N-acyltransferase [Deinococcus sp. YIM 77859]